MEQRLSSEPSPQPSRPLQAIASERHLPLSHLNGHRDAAIAFLPPLPCLRHASLGSSLPSRQDTTALQNSYAGRHCPLLHLNAPTGHSATDSRESNFERGWIRRNDLLRRSLHPTSSSPRGQSLFPSHITALDTQTSLCAHLNACSGHLDPFPEIEQRSSEPSSQSDLPSQTKNQLIQIPELLHWNVPAAHPVFLAAQLLPFPRYSHSHTRSMHLEWGSADRHSKSETHSWPKVTGENGGDGTVLAASTSRSVLNDDDAKNNFRRPNPLFSVSLFFT